MFQLNNILTVSVATFALVIFGLVLQFDAAANAVAVFQTQGMDSTAAALKVQKALDETAGLSPLRIDPSRGIVLTVYDYRSVDPRAVAASLTRNGYPTQISELLTFNEYKALTSGGSGCGSGGCSNCSKKQ